MPAYPVDLRVAGKAALVVGGGRVAVRRVEALLGSDAQVTVVAPEALPPLVALAQAGQVRWHRRRFAAGDCRGMALVLCAASEAGVGLAVYRDAKTHGAWVNVADQPERCDFYVGAQLRRGVVTVSVFTDGQAPGMASRIRDQIAGVVDERAARRVDAYRALRRRLRAAKPGQENAQERAEILAELSRSALLEGAPRAAGKIYLVGAGPGDPELLTRKAHRLIEEADDVVVDALVPPALYQHSRARVIYVGKRGGEEHLSQDAIARALVRLAQAGRRVVRLKGGDPSLFARLAEELSALEAEGIDLEVVPGVSSITAAAAAARTPLTARGVAGRLVVVSGHDQRGAVETLDLPAYRADLTLVVLMGLATLEPLSERLLGLGYPGHLPAVMVAHAGMLTERVVAAPLAQIAALVRAAALTPPATLIAGQVAARAQPARELLAAMG